ncbi:hypothetical protein [Burkholderia ubonensis]|uniref:Uncharacterized protein n=1 Tax=Burkholderia ubonensis TaxID=101571 RepID=A0A107EYN1_9BURK|nr:hypothetical protein [Burkholderia ubonensis]KWD81816.1 hypothetical protein WL70_17675 [Burkholderia ubonensis]KWD83776.1 hypothetical protein WL71_15780 [Burkholderia ubonensis]KWE04646.1 hypothetical protein WL72_01040 [Burkholderia ubonensis]KWE11021.1 hypothetical protein WL73_33290 [Burkholderia ubonensis]
MNTVKNRPHALTDDQILELGYKHFKPGHNVEAETNFVAAVRDVLAASPVEQPGPITAQIALAAIETFEIVGENNDSREPNADDRFILTEFIAHMFNGFRVAQPAAAPTMQHNLQGIARIDLELAEREARAFAPTAPATAPERPAFSVDDLDFEPDAQHTIADMANIGYALLEQIARMAPSYHWNDSPIEIVSDLINERDEARASSANETGAEGVRAWETDDGRVIADEQTKRMLANGGAEASPVRPYEHALYRSTTAQAVESVAIYQILTEEGAWLNTTREYYERVKSDPALARVVYSAPRLAAQTAILTRDEIGEAWREAGSAGVEQVIRNAAELAGAREGLTTERAFALYMLARTTSDSERWINELRKVFATHPGQAEPRAAASIPRVHGVSRIHGSPCEVVVMLMTEPTDEALRAMYDRLTYQPEPRAEAAPDDQRDGMRWRALMKNGEPEVFVERTQRRAIQRKQPVAFSSPNLTGADRFDTPSEMWVKRYVMFAWWARENEHRKFIEAVDAISAGEIQ